MKSIVAAIMMLLALPAFAQQQPDPAFLQKALNALQVQRNAALDGHASAEARAAMLADENAKLKAEIDEMKKKLPPEKPVK